MPYNDVILATTQAQLLRNVVRVKNNKPPLFMDVAEVDAALSFSGGLSATLSGLGIGKKGGPFRQGSLTSETIELSVGYAENPTIRYFPLSGQALVHQLATPISVDALPQMFDSDLPLGTILDFTVDRLTPIYSDFGPALNLLSELDYHNAITMSAGAVRADTDTRTQTMTLRNGSIVVQTTPPASPGHTALQFYVQARITQSGVRSGTPECRQTLKIAGLWVKLLQLYESVRTSTENANLTTLS